MAPSFGGMLLYEGDLKMRDCGVVRFVIAPFLTKAFACKFQLCGVGTDDVIWRQCEKARSFDELPNWTGVCRGIALTTGLGGSCVREQCLGAQRFVMEPPTLVCFFPCKLSSSPFLQPTTLPSPKSPSPPPQPSNDDIEAVIQMATSAGQTPDGRSIPIKDTRIQLFVGNVFGSLCLLVGANQPSVALQSSVAGSQRSFPSCRHRSAG